MVDRNFAIGLGVSLGLTVAIAAMALRLRPRPLLLPPVPVYIGVALPRELPAPPPKMVPAPPRAAPPAVASALPVAPRRPHAAAPKPIRQPQRSAATPAPPAAPTPGPGQVAVEAGQPARQGGFGPPIAPLPQPAGPPGAPLPHDTIYDADAVDRQPTPQDQPPPIYPAWARATGETAVVLARFVITAMGTVAELHIRVLEGDARFAAPVSSALAHWRFKPAAKAGLPVAVRAEQEFRFEMQP